MQFVSLQLALLDFGASREYSKKFVDDYIRVSIIYICDMIKLNQLFVGNIDFMICSPSKKPTSFVLYCFSNPTFTHISGIKCPILMGFSAKCTLRDVVKDHIDNSN